MYNVYLSSVNILFNTHCIVSFENVIKLYKTNCVLSGVSNSSLLRFGGGLEGVDLDPSAGSGSGHSVVGPFPPTKC